MVITSPFTTSVSGGTSLSITLGYGTNPVSVRDAGTWKVATYTIISGTAYMIDEDSASGLFTPVGGEITKASNIVASSYVTYATGVTYNFYL
jgi:hypothetical protein